MTTLVEGEDTTYYLYNGQGDRIAQIEDDVQTSYILDLNAGLTQVLNDSTTAYVYGLDLVSQQTGIYEEYPLRDALGSVRQVTVKVQYQNGEALPEVPVYAFSGALYSGISGVSDELGQVKLWLPEGNYRFRADQYELPFWSGSSDHCEVPGCQQVTLSTYAFGHDPRQEQEILYTYDALNRLTGAEYSSGVTFHYTYDGAGNRLSQEVGLDGEPVTTIYEYDEANRLTQVDDQDYTWDANGNLLDDGAKQYSYDPANRLTGLTDGEALYSYAYNGLGDRISQSIDGATETYQLDLNAGLTQVLSDGTNIYLYGNERIYQETGEAVSYFLSDALGSVRTLLKGEEVLLAQDYTPYGEVLASAGSGVSPYGYAGEWTDASGMEYLRARYYDPAVGRFLSRDRWEGVITYPSSLNRWMYVSGNPINRVDPFGLWELATGFNLHEGGIYGKGVLEMHGSPIKCKGTCIGTASTTIPIFVPPIANGILFNDQTYSRIGYTDIQMIERLIEYDILHKGKLDFCYINELIIPRNTDDWEVVYQYHGKSYAFSQGAFVDLSILGGVGVGYEFGYVPANIIMDPSGSYDNSAAIAFQLLQAQSEAERENLNLVEIFDKAGSERYEALMGGISMAVQGWHGLREFNSREFTITVQEHKHAVNFFRSVIETTSAFRNVKTDQKIISSYFLSFKNGNWQEELFNTATSR